MLPSSPPLSRFHSLCTDSISYNNNNKECCKCRPQTHTPSFTTSDPESSTVSEVPPLSLSLSIHACNDHLIFCTSIIFILFLVWFSSKTSSHKRRRIGHQWDRSSGGGAPRRGDTAIGYLILQGTNFFGQIA